MVFTKKYKEITNLRIITELAVEFTPFVTGKSKSKVTLKTQKSRQFAEILAIISNQPNSVILEYRLGWSRGFEPPLAPPQGAVLTVTLRPP